MAGLVLLALGLSFVVFGAIFIAEGLPKQEPSGGVPEALLGLEALVVAMGALKAWAAYLIGKHRRGGLELGLGIATWGAFFGGFGAWAALRDVLDPPPGSLGVRLDGLLLPIPYLIVLVGLLVGRAHFPGRPAR